MVRLLEGTANEDHVVGAVCYDAVVEVVVEAAGEAVGVSAAGIVGVAAVVEADADACLSTVDEVVVAAPVVVVVAIAVV